MKDLFMLYLDMLWPPNLYYFFKNWKNGMSGTGMGPAFYTMFLPFFWGAAIAALLTDIAIAICVIYFLVNHVSVH